MSVVPPYPTTEINQLDDKPPAPGLTITGETVETGVGVTVEPVVDATVDKGVGAGVTTGVTDVTADVKDEHTATPHMRSV